MNLLDLYGHGGHQARKATASEWCGPCPACGGHDRFRIWPSQGKDGLGRYWCRSCERSGDAIQYLRDFQGLEFREACDRLGVVVDGPRLAHVNDKPSPPKWQPQEAVSPPDLWQRQAKAFVRSCCGAMANGHGGPALNMLAHRGLNWAAVKRACLGVNPKDRYISRASWGLKYEAGKPDRFKIPAGLVLPWVVGQNVVVVQVRGNDGYKMLPGSKPRPFLLGDEGLALVVVESFLDGLLLHQEAGDLVGVVVMGSAQAKPRDDLMPVLERSKIMVALDSDEAGAKAAWTWWRENFPTTAGRWPVPEGKDPGEAFQAGVDIRAWVLAGLYAAELVDKERLAQLTESEDDRFQRKMNEQAEKRKKAGGGKADEQ